LERQKQSLRKYQTISSQTTPEILGARIGKVLNQYKTGKYITWEVKADKGAGKSQHHQVIWKLNEDVIERDQRLEGCYIITSNMRPEVAMVH
jgi:hypothetical protein